MPGVPVEPVPYCLGDFQTGQLWLEPDGDEVSFILRQTKGRDRTLGSMLGKDAWYNALTVGMALVADWKGLKEFP